jgi:hypothetical protein
MLSEGWRALVRKYIVYDVPDEMAACFDCNAVQCPNEKYETCPNRLARISHTGEQCGGNGGREVGDVEQAQ